MSELVQLQTSRSVRFNAGTSPVAGSSIEVYLCRNKVELKAAQRLRYEVYCGELGRNPPSADHSKRLIADALDTFGHTFVAVHNGETIGTLRGNFSRDGDLGKFEKLYGILGSPHYAYATATATKLVVKRSRRGSQAATKLILALVRHGLEQDIKASFLECIPSLLPYYTAMGFEACAPMFYSVECETDVHAMVLDMEKDGHRLATDGGPLACLKAFARNGRARNPSAPEPDAIAA
jgi:predicted GNAT family N-acyltransferase